MKSSLLFACGLVLSLGLNVSCSNSFEPSAAVGKLVAFHKSEIIPSRPVTDPRLPTESETPEPGVIEAVDPLLGADLLQLQIEETRGLSWSQVLDLNQTTIQNLYSIPVQEEWPNSTGLTRVTSILPETGQQVIDSIGVHPIVSESHLERYDQPKVSIGYCFGRATYVHLALLKMGVAKQSIRKLWIVGPMQSGGINWQFHVTTIVRVSNGQWMTLDSFTGKLMEVSEWLQYFYPMNKAYGNLRAYVTSPAKFSVSLPEYDRLQLGLDMKADEDWYRHYFRDLVDWFQDHSLEEVGLSDLRLSPQPQKD